jgi:hypothetical protein
MGSAFGRASEPFAVSQRLQISDESAERATWRNNWGIGRNCIPLPARIRLSVFLLDRASGTKETIHERPLTKLATG